MTECDSAEQIPYLSASILPAFVPRWPTLTSLSAEAPRWRGNRALGRHTALNLATAASGRKAHPLDRTHLLESAMLQHQDCPRCHAPNLSGELMCFACGAALGPRPKRFGVRPTQAPWILWFGLFLGLAIAGVIGWQVAIWLAGYRARLLVPHWYFPAIGLALLIAGQVGLAEARRIDRRWWRLKRAPLLRMTQVHTGDTVWLRGAIFCDSPLIAPYTAAECVYYRYLLYERQGDRAGWSITERETKCVDFVLAHQEKSFYVPSGGVLFDAQLYHEGHVDSLGNVRVKVWALPLGVPVSVCGQIVGDSERPRIDRIGDDLPAVASWREPTDYVAFTARRARLAQASGWLATIAGILILIASVARV